MSSAAPPSSGLRTRLETTSRPLLLRLHRLPRLVVPLGTVLLMVLGAFAPPAVGVLALLVLLVFLGWISYLSWPVVPASGRLLRVVMLVLVLAFALMRLRGHAVL